MTFPRYPKYRDSGVEWLGEVPEHWEVTRIANEFREVAEPGNDDLPILSVSIHHGVSDEEVPDEEMERKVSRSDDRSKYKRVEPGDLVYNMMRAWQGGFGTVNVPGMVSPAYVVARPRYEIETTFVEYLLRTPQAIEQMRRESRGVTDFRLRLYWERFKNIEVALPPREEATTICRQISEMDDRFKAMAETCQRAIDLLQERRIAVISHAVVKGLNPDAPMKDSGVEWLGEVPAHWEVVPVKRIAASIEQGWSPQCESYPAERVDEWGVLRVGCVNGGRFNPSENKLLPSALEPVESLGIRRGDLLISRANTRELVGSAAIARADFPNLLLCDKLYRLRFDSDVDPDFIAFYLGSDAARSRIEFSATGASASMVNISQSLIMELPVPRPSVAEQREIVVGISRLTGEIESLITEAQRAIDLLQERRTALISAAVTGLIDVRAPTP